MRNPNTHSFVENITRDTWLLGMTPLFIWFEIQLGVLPRAVDLPVMGFSYAEISLASGLFAGLIVSLLYAVLCFNKPVSSSIGSYAIALLLSHWLVGVGSAWLLLTSLFGPGASGVMHYIEDAYFVAFGVCSIVGSVYLNVMLLPRTYALYTAWQADEMSRIDTFFVDGVHDRMNNGRG